MKRLLLGAALALGLTAGASAATNSDSDGQLLPGDYDLSYATKTPVYCQVQVSTTAATLAALLTAASCPAMASTARGAMLTPEVYGSPVAVRYRADGTPPTASVGQPIQGWQNYPLQGVPALSASFISATGATVPMSVEIRG